MTYGEMKTEMESIIRDFTKDFVLSLPDDVIRLSVTNRIEFNRILTEKDNENMLVQSERLKKLYRENDVPDDISELFRTSGYGTIFRRTFGRGITD
jgi:hypothetical protein